MKKNFGSKYLINHQKAILIVLPNDSLGGAELYLKNIASYFLSQGDNVYVVFLKRRTTEEWSGLEKKGARLFFSGVNREKLAILHLIRYVYIISRQTNIEFTFSSHTHINGILGYFRKYFILNTKYLIARESTLIFERFHGLKLRRFKFYYQIGYDKTDLVVCQTSRMAKQLVDNLECSKKWNIEVIPNPISLQEIHDMAKCEVSPSPFEFGDYVVAAGRLIKLKGFDILIKSFSKLAGVEELNLLILGAGPELENLKQLITEYNLTNKVFMIGHVSNPIPYFKRARVCVVSSLIEGFPNVLLQMLSQNTRIVSTNCAGDIDKLPGVTICQSGKIDELKNAIDFTLNRDYDELKLSSVIDGCLKARSTKTFLSKVSLYINQGTDMSRYLD